MNPFSLLFQLTMGLVVWDPGSLHPSSAPLMATPNSGIHPSACRALWPQKRVQEQWFWISADVFSSAEFFRRAWAAILEAMQPPWHIIATSSPAAMQSPATAGTMAAWPAALGSSSPCP